MGAARYKPYPAYKPSGVEWLGDIPEGWKIFYGKRLFGNRREAALPSDEQLAASQAYGVVPQSVMMARNNAKVMLATKGTASFRHVQKDDFVISLRSFEGGIEHSAYSGCVSPAYTVLQPLERLNPQYFRYLLKSMPFVSALQATTDSLRDGKSISYEQFGAIALNLPPLPEQTKIAAFLDFETGKIDALIAKQERLIALLEEKRQAVISHAVTKGLNPNAPLRPSGIDWLGDVPEHWEVRRIKYLGEFIPGFAFNSGDFTSSGVRVLKIANIQTFSLDFSEASYVPERFYEQHINFAVLDGDVVFALTRPIISTGLKAAIATVGSESVLLNQRNAIFRPIDTIHKGFLYRTLFADFFLNDFQIRIDITGQQPNISTLEIQEISVPVPPPEEQESISAFLDLATQRFTSLIDKAHAAATLLKERRTALISAAVTGKIDVRDWQPPQPLSDTDLSTETLQEAAL